MTNKEFKKLNRADLIEIIYQLQLKQTELENTNQQLREQIGHMNIRISQAGSIADAALSINGVFEAAQKAADQYLEGIYASKSEFEARYEKIIKDAEQKADEIIKQAEAEGIKIMEQTDRDVVAIWDEFNEKTNQILEKCKMQIHANKN